MVFFKNCTIITTKYTEVENSVGHPIKSYAKDVDYMVNIQPIEQKQVEKTWGSDLESTYQMYFDEMLNVGDVISWNNRAYEIEKVIDWVNYKLYALNESDVIIN